MERSFGNFNGQAIWGVKARHGLRPDQCSRAILPSDADPWHEIFKRISPVVGKWMTAHDCFAEAGNHPPNLSEIL